MTLRIQDAQLLGRPRQTKYRRMPTECWKQPNRTSVQTPRLTDSCRFFLESKESCYEHLGYNVDGAKTKLSEAVADLDPEQAKQRAREQNQADRDSLSEKYGINRQAKRRPPSTTDKDVKLAPLPRQPGEGGWLDTLTSADLSDIWDALSS